MNKFFTFTLVLFASAALGHCSGYSAGPAVQQVSLGSLPNIDQYLNGAQTAYAPVPAPLSLSPATSVVLPSAPAYGAAPANAYGAAPANAYGAAPANAYGAAPVNAYGAAPAYAYGAAPAPAAVQQAWSTQLYPGQQNYKAYVSPPQHSKVALPILPAEPVAKVWLPQQSAYAAPAAAKSSYNQGGY